MNDGIDITLIDSNVLVYAYDSSDSPRQKKQFWDTLIVATMLEAGVSTIYTENEKDFSSFEMIKTINPFQ